MNTVSFLTTRDVYDCASGHSSTSARISHSTFAVYSTLLRRLIRGLGDAASEEMWKRVLNPLRRYGFSLCAAPLPFDEPSIVPDIREIRSCVATLAQSYPAAAMVLGETIECLANLVQCKENPYLEWLAQCCPTEDKNSSAVLICNSRLIKATEHQLSERRRTHGLEVIVPPELVRHRCFDALYVIGAKNWFPEYVFTAPRAKRTLLVRYAWLRDQHVPAKGFLTTAPVTELRPEEPAQDSYIDPNELLPVVDWRSIGRRLAADDLKNPLETADASLVLLEGDMAVFLETGDGCSVLTIDLDADDSTGKIARIETRELRRGNFILLRTVGGGDYIVTEADAHFLKRRAPELRAAQKVWKQLLRQAVQKEGLLSVSLRLIEYGSATANEINVRNYLSPRSIRTRERDDFRAIMLLVGLGEDWEHYWDMMAEIDHAHRHAGQYIRRQLLRRLSELDLKELERTGRMEITLEHANAGSLTAFRVIEVAPDLHSVSTHRLGHPFYL